VNAEKRYEVVAVDVSTDPANVTIEWLAISADSNRLCPYVVLQGPIFRRLSGYHLIRKDLNFAETALLLLKDLHNTNTDRLILQSLWFFAAVSYGKCFVSAEGRGVKLENKNVFKSAKRELIEAHDIIMHERHQYIAHAGDINYEISNTMLALNPDDKHKEMFGLYHSIFLSVGILGERIKDYLRLIAHVKVHIEKVLDKLFPVALAEAKKTATNEWYAKAKYPVKNIAQRANELTLTAPSGGVLEKIHVRVEIQPESAGVLIYGAPDYDLPKRFNGPVSEGEIVTTEPKVYFQKINGVEKLKISTLGYVDRR
jgi:hypothetical protein